MTPRSRRYHEAVRAVEKHGSKAAAARALGVSREVIRDRIERGPGDGEATAAAPDDMDVALLRDKVRTLTAQLQAAKAATLSDEQVRRAILKIADADPSPPEWLIRAPKKGHVTGVPTLVLSDWHFSEVIEPGQINGINAYNTEIAHRRARTVVEMAINLLRTQFANPSYPGIVVCLGGDFLSGNIHLDLETTNDVEIMPSVLDLFGVLVWAIGKLADEFGNVFVPAVVGNHSRTTHKPRAKNRAFLSYEWLIYQLLDRWFSGDKRVRFQIPEGPDAYYKIYDHAFLLTHGDQYKGGDGMVGSLGPILRGDHKKRTRNSQIGQPFHTMILGHFHQLMMLDRVIVNGSLSGYSEYAHQLNLPYEAPRQALFVTHQHHGITLSAPINADRPSADEFKPSPWVSWKDAR